MKTLPWTFFILGMLLNAAVWWATDVEAWEYWQQRCLVESTGTGARKDRPCLASSQPRPLQLSYRPAESRRGKVKPTTKRIPINY
jgi:hypothetical protein